MLGTSARAGDADKDTVKMVEYFLKAPVSDLPAGHIDEFLNIDPETLPKKLRERFKGKRLELYTLRRLSASKKKGTYRTPEPDCEAPKEGKSNDVGALKMAGYVELFEEDLICIEKETHCTPHDLMCEFTLQIFVEVKGKKKLSRFFMHENDVMMGVVAGCRGKSGAGQQTNFFGVMKPLCQH